MDFFRFSQPKHQTLLKILLRQQNFSHSDRLLGCSKGRGITWFLDTQAEFGFNLVKRHYYRGGMFGKFIRDHYFFTGIDNCRAAKEFALLQRLIEFGLPVPRPIAFRVTKRFCCYQADILIEKLENSRDLSQYLQQQPLTEAHYQQLGRLLRQLHDHQVHHSDLNIHNIMFCQGKQQFYLIDFDKCQIQAGENWKAANLARLHRSFYKEIGRLKIHFNAQNWQDILIGYCK